MGTGRGLFQKEMFIDVDVCVCPHLTCGPYSWVYVCKLVYLKILHYYPHEATGVEMGPKTGGKKAAIQESKIRVSNWAQRSFGS